MTFYYADNVPSDSRMEDTLKRITQCHAFLGLLTPIAETWRAYCDVMLHSLVVIDRTRDVGLIVYTCNEMTKKISGQFVEHWLEKERWCLGNPILGSKLPLDVIEICDRSKTISKTSTTKIKDICVDISDTRFFKNSTDRNAVFTTRLDLGSYNVMAMRETQTQFEEKCTMLVVTDLNGKHGTLLFQ